MAEGSKENAPLLLNAEDEVIAATPKRWAVLASFMINALLVQAQYVTFATIVRETQSFFEITSTEVNILAAVFQLCYVIGVFPGCALYGRLGLSGGIRVGATSNAVGTILKVIAVLWYRQYWVLVISQLFSACGQVLFLSIPPLLASTWFPDSERTAATALGAFSSFIGLALGMFVPPRIVTDDHHGETQFAILFGVQAGIAVLGTLAVFLFVDRAPKFRPSVTATKAGENSRSDADLSVFASLKLMGKNTSLMMVCATYSLVVGTCTGIATVLSQLLQPVDVTEAQTGNIACLGIVIGSCGCIVVAPLVDKHRKYKLPTTLLAGACLILFGITYAIVKCTSGGLVAGAYIMLTLIELSALPLSPVVMEFAVELTYPLSATIASSCTAAMMCGWSVVCTVLFGFVLTSSPSRYNAGNVILIATGMVFAAVVVSAVVKEDLKRRAHEKASSERKEADGSGSQLS